MNVRTVLLRLDGPLQAWGTGSVFERRRTGPWPTKSGVLGICAAALGYSRNTDLTRLAALDIAVRVDQPGRTITDLHAVGTDGWVNAEGAVTVGQCKMSTRDYLADAVFVVGVGGDDIQIVNDIDAALNAPRYHLYLGRRSCPPAAPLRLGTADATPAEALARIPYQGRASRAPARLLTIVTDPGGVRVADQPVSFAPLDRRYGLRGTSTKWSDHDDHDPYGIGDNS